MTIATVLRFFFRARIVQRHVWLKRHILRTLCRWQHKKSSISYTGKMFVNVYSARQRRTIRKMEAKWEKRTLLASVGFLPFEEFFLDIMPEAIGISFRNKRWLWQYYHRSLCDPKESGSFTYHNNHFFAAVDITMIICAAESSVLINKTPQSHEVLSIGICAQALRFADIRGVNVCIVPCQRTDSFFISNDRHMMFTEKFFLHIE